MTEKRIAPYIEADKIHALILCPNHCSKGVHYHGIGEGHRGAHCRDQTSETIDYWLVRANDAEAAVLRDVLTYLKDPMRVRERDGDIAIRRKDGRSYTYGPDVDKIDAVINLQLRPGETP